MLFFQSLREILMSLCKVLFYICFWLILKIAMHSRISRERPMHQIYLDCVTEIYRGGQNKKNVYTGNMVEIYQENTQDLQGYMVL